MFRLIRQETTNNECKIVVEVFLTVTSSTFMSTDKSLKYLIDVVFENMFTKY